MAQETEKELKDRSVQSIFRNAYTVKFHQSIQMCCSSTPRWGMHRSPLESQLFGLHLGRFPLRLTPARERAAPQRPEQARGWQGGQQVCTGHYVRGHTAGDRPWLHAFSCQSPEYTWVHACCGLHPQAGMIMPLLGTS